VSWAQGLGIPVTIVSDGLGLYIEPLLTAAGISDVAVVTNDWAGGAMAFPNGHPECIWCGTCKMLAVQRAPGPVAFVGEGHSDRFGALYADIVFAKDVLVELCRDDGVPFLPYEDFDDVRRALESADDLPGAVAPLRCPGWTTRSGQT
jgi:2-hydroxy-3-keto-5-methylthiopentenyl-1-phosphate phosphatase